MAEQMKPSGIDWIGDIPNSWKVKPIAYMTKSRSGGTPDRNNLLYWENGTIPWMSSGEVNKVNIYDTDEKITTLAVHHSSAKIISKNAVMVALNGQGKTKGMSAILRIDSACNQSLCAFSCNAGILYYEYLFWCFQTMYTYLRQMSGDDVRDGLAASYVKKQKIPVPKYEEQQAIADFLDKECAQIDSIAADLEKQIELLQQYKKSLITETVTKGLDKSVPMKDSGVEWLGKIPAHWQKTRIKFEASIIGSGTTPDSGNSMYYDNGEHSWIQSGDLYGKDYIYETEKQLTNLAILECHALNWYTKDFVVVAMYGASVGNVAISKIDSFTNQACCVIKLNEKNDNRYLFYFLKAAQEEMLLKAFGGTQPNISQIIIKNLNFLNVPLLEQIEIADFLDSKCDMINEMLKSKKDQYDILIKHKKSLIYEYVTGKKRVKEVQ